MQKAMQHTQRILFSLLSVITLLLFHSHVRADTVQWQSHDSIRSTATAFLNDYAASAHAGRTEIQLGKLDPRLKLKACPEPLQGYMSPGSRDMGNTTVGVRCPAEGGWSIYVPAKIKVFGPVLVARHPLARGKTISRQDLELVERNLAVLPYGYFAEPGPVIGKLVKRTLAANSVLTPQMLQAPRLVKRGERVTLLGESGPLKVRMVGEALSDGGKGDLIRVRTDGSRRVIDGTVIAQGVIKVTL